MKIKKTLSNEEFLFGDFDKDKTVNIDDEQPFNKNKKATVEEAELGNEFKEIRKEQKYYDKPRISLNKKLQKQDYDTVTRLKGVRSIMQKLRKKYIGAVKDIGGITILVNSYQKVYDVLAEVKSNYSQEITEIEDYYKNPKPGRDAWYRAIHLSILENGRPIEVKIMERKHYYTASKKHKKYKLR